MTKHKESLTAREEMVQIVKDLGQSVIEMAEDIVGDAAYLTDLDITLRLYTFDTRVPSIEISKEHAPAAYIRRRCGEATDATQADFLARKTLADLAGGTVNDSTNSLTRKFIFGGEENLK